MFREVLRKKQVLTKEEIDGVLSTALRGVLAVNGEDGFPYALPINFYYDKAAAKIYFHSGKVGYKVDCLKNSSKACFTTQDQGARGEGEWWLTIKSVIAFGEIEEVTDKKEVERISRALSYKFTTDGEYIKKEIEKYLDATLLLSFTIRHLTGKIVKEK